MFVHVSAQELQQLHAQSVNISGKLDVSLEKEELLLRTQTAAHNHLNELMV